ncbi:alpha/beta hydrolase [Taibaiella lutea]|uniref:Alpha/beta hydrolase n=1 Tax=Taibaiella lutea TaxID=2608001 RepID=A0A5M6CPL4_9BACT|nr:alpha/beta hydrolase [Taibaiella lutea]KAA5537094.1 alpha/beta hydrolase [Taibaiella lutea]
MKNLILLHGALGHSSNFEPYESFLSQHFNVHKVLFHGHGGSEIPAAGLSIELYVEQLQQYLEQQELNDIYVFGYSMGGYVAMCHALQYPGKITSILTLATKLNWTIEGAAKEVKMLEPELIESKVPRYAAQLMTLHGENHWKQLLPAIATLMTRLAVKPLLTQTQYESLNLPVQMMVGDKDAMVSIDETLFATKNIPNANFAVLPDTKHPIEMARPELLIGLMKDFWKI